MKFEDSIRDLQCLNREYFNWRRKFLLYFWGTWLYDPVRERLLARSNTQAFGGNEQSSASTGSHDCYKGIAAPESGAPEERRLIEIGLPPRMHPIGRAYQMLTNVTIVFYFVKLTILFVDPNDSLAPSYYLRCYTPRFVLIAELEEKLMPVLTYVLCVNNLIWRLAILKLRTKFDLDVIPFLLAKTSIVEERIRLGPARLNRLEEPSAGRMDILDESMFFRGQQNEYILRPNRSLSARRELIDTINFYFNGSVLVGILVALFSVALGGYTLFFRQNSLFVNCGRDVTPFDAIYYYRVFSSGLVSVLYFIDAMIALFLITTCGYLFTLDLLIYWRHCRTEIDKCHLKTIAKLLAAHQQQLQLQLEQQRQLQQQLTMADMHDEHLQHSIAHKTQLSGNMSCRRYGELNSGRLRDAWYQTRQIDDHPNRLKCSLIDFFEQLRKVDQFITLLIPAVMGVWQTCNFAVSISGLQFGYQSGSQELAVRFYQVLGIFAATGVCGLILRLKRNTEPAYPLLCSIVARERSLHKRIWISLLGIYTLRPRYAFTFLYGSIFKGLTFLKIISYTLTITVIIEGMRFSRFA